MRANKTTVAVLATLLALSAQAQEAAIDAADTVTGPVVQDIDAIDRIEDATGAPPVAVALYPLYDDEGYLMPPLDPSVIAGR